MGENTYFKPVYSPPLRRGKRMINLSPYGIYSSSPTRRGNK
jgi:hypothetical protein